jgi:hypothetical protein
LILKIVNKKQNMSLLSVRVSSEQLVCTSVLTVYILLGMFVPAAVVYSCTVGPGSLASSAATDSGEGGGPVEDAAVGTNTLFQMWTVWLVSMSAMPGKL